MRFNIANNMKSNTRNKYCNVCPRHDCRKNKINSAAVSTSLQPDII